jgi:peptidyl-prolyl cis-trans isomerase D
MAVIQKIRNKYGKIAAGIIVLSLIGFILMDATSSGRFNDIFRGGGDHVMKVNGEKVSQKEYLQRQHEYEVLYSAFNPDFKMTDQSRASLNDQVLRELMYEKLVMDESEKLGLTVSKEEEKELIYGADPYQLIKQYPQFKNQQTQMFDPQMVKQYEQALNSSQTQIDPERRAKLKEEWEILKAFAIRSYRTNKYNSAVTAALTVPNNLVEADLKERQQMANISYVMVPYAMISDDEAKVSDDEIKAYMEKHKASYMVYEPSRSIEYVSFDVMPTGDDSSKSLGALQKLKDEFAAATDNESIVNKNSDDNYTDAYVNKRIFMSRYSDSILNLPVGAVYGPYFEEGNFKLSKVVDRKTYPDSVKFRLVRIFTKANGQDIRTDSAAKMRMDSAVAAINGGMPFNEVLKKFSDDDANSQTAGEFTYTVDQKQTLPEELQAAVFDGKAGDKKTIDIKDDNFNALFYVEVMEQTGFQPAVKIATITKSLSAGTVTDQAVYGKANEFAGKNNNEKAFDAAAKTHPGRRMAENIKETDFMIQGLEGGNSREIIRWAYEAKVGDVSQVFNLENRYIVAKLTGIQEKGLPKITDNNRPALERKVKNEKKAAIITSRYKGASLAAIAQQSGRPVQQADSISLAMQYIPNLGYEPKVTGYTFFKGFQPNTVSPAIKGQEAVYYISVLSRWESPLPQAMPNMMENQRRQLEGQMMQSAGSALMDMLKKNADIKYNVRNL